MSQSNRLSVAAEQIMDSSGTETTPRALVQYTIYEADSDGIKTVAYEATQPNGVLSSRENWEKDVIGWAEFPPHTQIGRRTVFDEFASMVEEESSYVHWKPDVVENHNG